LPGVVGKMKKLRYHLLRALTHPQLLSMIFAVIVIVAWVHWRKPVGELKLNPWVAIIFLAIIFRPAVVELLRRTDKISTSWAELSMKRLEEDVEQAEAAEETNNPQPIRIKMGKVTSDPNNFGPHSDTNPPPEETADTGSSESSENAFDPSLDPFDDPATIREQASDMLTRLPSLKLLRRKDFEGTDFTSERIAFNYLKRRLAETERLVLQSFGPEDGPRQFTPEIAEHLAAWTGVSGWTNVIDVWRRTMKQLYLNTDENRSLAELRMVTVLAESALDILVKQLEAVAKFGRTE
jgi:hypothetical protein